MSRPGFAEEHGPKLFVVADHRQGPEGTDNLLAAHPASADQLRRMMQQVAKLDAQAKPSLIQTTAWVYQAGAGKSVRFDVGVEDGNVRRIFTSSCNAK